MRKAQICPQTRFYEFEMSALFAVYNIRFTSMWNHEKDQKAYKSSELDLVVISQSLLTDRLTSVSQFVVFYWFGTKVHTFF